MPRRGLRKIIWPPPHFSKGREMSEMPTFCIFKPSRFLAIYAAYAEAVRSTTWEKRKNMVALVIEVKEFKLDISIYL